jgi:hypothetical protein
MAAASTTGKTNSTTLQVCRIAASIRGCCPAGPQEFDAR